MLGEGGRVVVIAEVRERAMLGDWSWGRVVRFEADLIFDFDFDLG